MPSQQQRVCDSLPSHLANTEESKGGEEVEVKYTPQGEPGKTCANCKFYTPQPDNPGKGDCFGHEVEAKGSCNMFQPEEK